MAFADPQSVTINAVANSLARTYGNAGNVGTFVKDDDTCRLTVSHTYSKRTRRAIQLTFSKIAADPLIAGVNLKYTAKVTVVIDEPPVGFTRTEMKQITDGFMTYLTASTGAKMVQVLAGEN